MGVSIGREPILSVAPMTCPPLMFAPARKFVHAAGKWSRPPRPLVCGVRPNSLSTATTEPRDPRVPPVGSVVRRVFDGKTHEVTVCVEGFEYEGRKYKTLSAIANQIAGSRWNGFLFFGLKKRGDDASEESAA